MYYYIQKLKTSQSFTDVLIIGGIFLVYFITLIFTGLETAIIIMGLLVFIYGLYSLTVFIVTRNKGYLVVTLFQFSMALLCGSVALSFSTGYNMLIPIFLLPTLFFGIWMINLAINKKGKWRGREIFELAAMPVDELADSYTGRPFPAGVIEGTRADMLAFGRFTSKNLIALTYLEPEKVVFLPVMTGREYGMLFRGRSDYADETWVSFDNDGNVAVNISMDDYLHYREELSFDQLCESLGELFIEFFSLFRRGEGARVIDRIDALGLSSFS